MRKHSTTKTIKKTPQKTTGKQEDPALAEYMAEFERGLKEFAHEAYKEAVSFYSEHHNDPMALRDLQVRNTFTSETHPGWVELTNAVRVIATCDFAPLSLKQPVIDFLSSESGAIWGGLMVRPPIIQKILIAASCRQSNQEEDDDATN